VQVVDWHEWAPHCDLVSWDSYPVAGEHWAHTAFGHDLARGASGRGELLVMEASPGPVNWHELCALKRPGEVRLEALQAVGRGARGMLYFQLRQAVGGAELNHAALIPRHGRLDTRVGRELVATSSDLRALSAVPAGLAVDGRIALVFDWPSWWAHHNTPGLDQRSRYLDVCRSVHRALAERGLVVDVVGAHGPFHRYDAVVAPLLHLVDDITIDALDAFARSGGILVTTTGSAITGATAQVHRDGIDPRWRALTGVWIEETDVQPAERRNRVGFTDGRQHHGRELFDIVRTETADVVAVFGDDFYAGSPAVTVNRVGDGSVVYVASIDAELVASALDDLATATAPITDVDHSAVECVLWRGPGGRCLYVLNHGERAASIVLDGGPWTDVLTGVAHRGVVELAAHDAAVLRHEPPPTSYTNQGEPS
jgi:beta-galactosidase